MEQFGVRRLRATGINGINDMEAVTKTDCVKIATSNAGSRCRFLRKSGNHFFDFTI